MDVREKAILVYLDDKMEANAEMIGEHLQEQFQCEGKPGSIAAPYLGRMRKKGWIARVPDLKAWRITGIGRAAMDL